MTSACMAGTVACLLFGGVEIPAENAINIIDECELIANLGVREFEGNTGFGVFAGRSMEEQGLKLSWPETGEARKTAWTASCHQFTLTFEDSSRWKNIQLRR